jgi:hypothetical protein
MAGQMQNQQQQMVPQGAQQMMMAQGAQAGGQNGMMRG